MSTINDYEARGCSNQVETKKKENIIKNKGRFNCLFLDIDYILTKSTSKTDDLSWKMKFTLASNLMQAKPLD